MFMGTILSTGCRTGSPPENIAKYLAVLSLANIQLWIDNLCYGRVTAISKTFYDANIN